MLHHSVNGGTRHQDPRSSCAATPAIEVHDDLDAGDTAESQATEVDDEAARVLEHPRQHLGGGGSVGCVELPADADNGDLMMPAGRHLQ